MLIKTTRPGKRLEMRILVMLMRFRPIPRIINPPMAPISRSEVAINVLGMNWTTKLANRVMVP